MRIRRGVGELRAYLPNSKALLSKTPRACGASPPGPCLLFWSTLRAWGWGLPWMPSQPSHKVEKYVLTHNLHSSRPDYTFPSSPWVQASMPTPDIPQGLTAVTWPPPTTLALLWAGLGGHYPPAQPGLNRCWQREKRNLGLGCLPLFHFTWLNTAPPPETIPSPPPKGSWAQD